MEFELVNKQYSGKVKWFTKKGFGVVKCNEIEKEIFIHHSQILTNSKNFILLEENEEVTFNVENINNKLSCTNVQAKNGKFSFEQNNQKKKFNKKRRKKRNTESFTPTHKPSDMRIIAYSGSLDKYDRKIYSNEVILVNNLFGLRDYYCKLSDEIMNCGIPEDQLFKLWHGDTHIIADDKKGWKEKCPTFNMIINKIKDFFNMDIQATRFNWYKDSEQWKPFHHDAAAIKPDKAKVQNITVGVSFGAEREAAFEHAKTRTVISTPLGDGSIYIFNKDVNIEWRHGILQVPEERKHNHGRMSIIAWGKVNMEKKFV